MEEVTTKVKEKMREYYIEELGVQLEHFSKETNCIRKQYYE